MEAANQSPMNFVELGRVSRFVEASMDSKKSIHPPPSFILKDRGAYTPSPVAPAVETTKKKAGWFQHIVTAFKVFHRVPAESKAEEPLPKPEETPKPPPYSAAEAAAKLEELRAAGLIPEPKIHVRPPPQRISQMPSTPRAVHRSLSAKDLREQDRILRKVSKYELKLEAAIEEHLAKYGYAPGQTPPPVPSIKSSMLSTSTVSSHHTVVRKGYFAPDDHTFLFAGRVDIDEEQTTTPTSSKKRKITRKRKSLDDHTYEPLPQESEDDSEYEPAKQKKRKRSKITKAHKKEEKVITAVPDGHTVPPMPPIPSGVEGKRATNRLWHSKSLKFIRSVCKAKGKSAAKDGVIIEH